MRRFATALEIASQNSSHRRSSYCLDNSVTSIDVDAKCLQDAAVQLEAMSVFLRKEKLHTKILLTVVMRVSKSGKMGTAFGTMK